MVYRVIAQLHRLVGFCDCPKHENGMRAAGLAAQQQPQQHATSSPSESAGTERERFRGKSPKGWMRERGADYSLRTKFSR
jgi:hypothetical protein